MASVSGKANNTIHQSKGHNWLLVVVFTLITAIRLSATCQLSAILVAIICCCCSSFVLANPQQPSSTTSSTAPLQVGRPPRGYCTHISRAVTPNSLCYDHLIRDRYAYWRENSPQVSSAKTSTSSKDNAFSQSDDAPLHQHHLKSTVAAMAARKEEELVYVRLETVGSSIQDLNTLAINERLLQGIYRELLQVVPSTSPSTSPSPSPSLTPQPTESTEDGGRFKTGEVTQDKRQKSKAKEQTDDLSFVKAQILSPPLGTGEGQRLADKCRLSMEKFLCRMAYPSCHFRHKDISALVRPPCREDCYLLRDVFCSNLDWFKFTRTLVGAFNNTLMSMINELDLATQGEQLSSDTLAATTSNKEANSISSGHLNSSIHYYWPHEHSIQNCELLPTIRSIHKPSSNNSLTVEMLKQQQQQQQQQNTLPDRFSLNINHLDAIQNTTPKTQVQVESSHDRQQQQQHRWPLCSDASLTRIPAPSIYRHNKIIKLRTTQALSSDCLTSDDGLTYTGTTNLTQSGLVCQNWHSQQPHKHKESELLFENMRKAHNYCRNPGGLELKPWCYTQDLNVRWEYCNIKAC